MDFELTSDEVVILQTRGKIAAILEFRTRTGLGLYEAKQIIDKWPNKWSPKPRLSVRPGDKVVAIQQLFGHTNVGDVFLVVSVTPSVIVLDHCNCRGDHHPGGRPTWAQWYDFFELLAPITDEEAKSAINLPSHEDLKKFMGE